MCVYIYTCIYIIYYCTIDNDTAVSQPARPIGTQLGCQPDACPPEEPHASGLEGTDVHTQRASAPGVALKPRPQAWGE